MFIDRDEHGSIKAVYENKQHDGQEYLAGAVVPVSLKAQAVQILARATMERIQRAVIAGRTTWATPDVVEHCAWLDKIQAIATGKDTASTSLPALPVPEFPLGT